MGNKFWNVKYSFDWREIIKRSVQVVGNNDASLADEISFRQQRQETASEGKSLPGELKLSFSMYAVELTFRRGSGCLKCTLSLCDSMFSDQIVRWALLKGRITDSAAQRKDLRLRDHKRKLLVPHFLGMDFLWCVTVIRFPPVIFQLFKISCWWDGLGLGLG